MQIKNIEGVLLRSLKSDSLKGADLRGADLIEADLRWADLRRADLRGTVLRGANLRGAILRWANLHEADLTGADLRGADLRDADLRKADLSRVDLRDADLKDAELSGAHVEGAVLPPPIVPSEGEFLGYKKVLRANGTYTVIKLLIPAYAQRTSALASRKCRASRVEVVEGEGVSPTNSRSKLRYTAGVTVTANRFNADRREECTHGIHFFLTKDEAQAYQP